MENMMDEKRAKFMKLAEARANRVIKDIRLIGNLSNRSAYTYGKEDVRKIFMALQKELDNAKWRFGKDPHAREEGFRLE